LTINNARSVVKMLLFNFWCVVKKGEEKLVVKKWSRRGKNKNYQASIDDR
jgi:hypothetical protein